MSEARFEAKGIVPTAEQLAIQLERRKHVIVEANAGAAKTTTLALRIAQAIVRGAEAERIQALTYTGEAVQALRQALDRIGMPAGVRARLRIQTFDAFCASRLLPIEGAAVPLLDKAEALQPHVLRAIERVLDNPDERHRDEFAVEGAGEAMVEGLLASFQRLKGTMQLALEIGERTPSPALAEELGLDYLTMRVFWAYEHLRRGGHPDHHAFRTANDATYDLARMLLDEDTFAGMPPPLEMGLQLIAVDEMHDTSRAMFTVLKQVLAQNPVAAFIGVGDRDQVIHAQAGADAAFMGERFDAEIGRVVRFPLSATYRFGPALAAPAGRLAGKAYASLSTRDTRVRALPFADEREAHRHVVKAILEREGLPAKASVSEMAILLRQAHHSVLIENQLLDLGIAYRTAGFDTYLMRPEVLFVRGLIAHACDRFADIEQADTRERILRAMLLFCGARVNTGDASQDEQMSAQDRVREEKAAVREVATAPAMARAFIENQVLRNARPEARAHVQAAIQALHADRSGADLQGFVDALMPHRLAARVLVRAEDIAQVSANLAGLVQSAAGYDHIASFFRAMNEREVRQQGMRGKDCIVLSSIEAAKGLEFEHVFMPGLHRGVFAVGGHTTDNRNLLYVGMTRAKNQLTLLYDPNRPSKYLRDAGLI